MNPRAWRVLILVLLGVSVSIVPVRAHYALTPPNSVTGPTSSLLPRAQQRIRLVSMRDGSERSQRAERLIASATPYHFKIRADEQRSSSRPSGQDDRRLPSLSALAHPLRC